MQSLLSPRQTVRLAAQVELLGLTYGPGDAFTCLDVGAEFGLTGRKVGGAFPNATIDGIDIYGPTITNALEYNGQHYATLRQEDARLFLAETEEAWDVGIAAEVIEHMDKDDGPHFLASLRERCERVIVTTPLGYLPYGEKSGNPYDLHRCGWTQDEMEALGFKTFAVYPQHHIGVYYSGDLRT